MNHDTQLGLCCFSGSPVTEFAQKLPGIDPCAVVVIPVNLDPVIPHWLNVCHCKPGFEHLKR